LEGDRARRRWSSGGVDALYTANRAADSTSPVARAVHRRDRRWPWPGPVAQGWQSQDGWSLEPAKTGLRSRADGVNDGRLRLCDRPWARR